MLQQEPPAVVVEEELQGPEGGGVAVDGAEDAAAVLDRRLEGGEKAVALGAGWWCGLQPAAEGGEMAGLEAGMGQPVVEDGGEGMGVGITEIVGVELQQLAGGEQLVFGEEGSAEGIAAAAAASGAAEAIGGEGVVEGGLHLPWGPEATVTTGGGGEALGQVPAHPFPTVPVVGVVEEMTKEGEDVEEGDAIGQARQAADRTGGGAGPGGWVDHRPVVDGHLLPMGGEAHGIEPVEVGGDGAGVVVTGAMEAAEEGGGAVGDTGGGKGSEELAEFGIEGGVRRGQLWVITQQPQEVEETLKIQQPGVAMQFMGGITVGATVDAVIEAGKSGGDELLEGNALAGLEANDMHEALLPLRHRCRLEQLGAMATDDGLWHRPLPLIVPGEALLEGSIEPPADPLNRCREVEGLGDGEAKGTADVTGLEDDGGPLVDGIFQLLLDHGFYLLPVAEAGGIAIELLADVGAGDVANLRRMGLEEKGLVEESCGGAFAAAGGTDEEMKAQGRQGMGGSHGWRGAAEAEATSADWLGG